jgi:SAM-dependent methyltransferase
MESSYYEQAEIFDDEFLADPGAVATRIETTIGLIPPHSASLLDVGAGDGRLAEAIRQARPDLTRLVITDRSMTGLSRSSTTRVASSGQALPFGSDTFDIVTACELLEHLPPGIFERTCTEMARVATQNVLVTVPNAERRRRADLRCRECGCVFNRLRHLRSFSPGSMAELLPGFRLQRVLEFGPHPPVYPRAARHLAERLGVLHVPPHAFCPQCGTSAASHRTSRADGGVVDDGGGLIRQFASPVMYGRIRRFVPHSRRPYWLAAIYERR